MRLIDSLYSRYARTVSANKIFRFRSFYEDKRSLSVLKDCFIRLSSKKDCVFLNRIIAENKMVTLYELSDHEPSDRLVFVYRENDHILKYTRKMIKNTVWNKNHEFINADKAKNMPFKSNDVVIVLDPELKSLFPNIKTFSPPNGGRLIGYVDEQYYDIFSPREDEYVVDAGAFDGQSSVSFLNWGTDKIQKVYAFEADPQNAKVCKQTFMSYGDERLVLFEKGLWSHNCRLSISNDTSGSGATLSADETSDSNYIDCVSLDGCISDNKITFIKMDIEGAELEALHGAEKTIVKNKPRLAICVYHKPTDLIDIPEYLLSIVPEYRFYLRHYSTTFYETVLYAEVVK